jgi:hypothetical protein
LAQDEIDAIRGDSAGGNLAITLIHRLRAAGEDLPACRRRALEFAGTFISAQDRKR